MTAVDVNAVVEGPVDAPVVLLAGSLGSTLEMWDSQLPALAERFRVVRYDARGHGRSPVPPGPYALDDLVDDAVALLDRLGVVRAHVVGLSLGGMTALRLAAREPHRVDRVAVLCCSALLGPAAAWTERAAIVRAQGTVAVAPAVVSRWFTPELRATRPDLVERMEAMVAATPAEGYAGCCEAIAAMDLRADLERVEAPLLAIAGAADPATPPEHLAAVADGAVSGQLLVLPRAAHLASVERPEAVSAALLTHLGAPHVTDAHSLRARGMRVRRAVLGDAHVDRAVARTTPLTAPFQDLITRYAWGDVWSRPGLDRRTRSQLTLALLSALGHEAELAMHVRAAVRNGLTAEEIGEVLLHTAVYAGVPAANSALAVAQEVLDELGLDGAAPGTSADEDADEEP
jgi:3-oxoadipate enol-lactonase/4-carboxymuconolactone decarboxylase